MSPGELYKMSNNNANMSGIVVKNIEASISRLNKMDSAFFELDNDTVQELLSEFVVSVVNFQDAVEGHFLTVVAGEKSATTVDSAATIEISVDALKNGLEVSLKLINEAEPMGHSRLSVRSMNTLIKQSNSIEKQSLELFKHSVMNKALNS